MTLVLLLREDATRKEVQTIGLIDRPSLPRAYCSFATAGSLWLVMPFMAAGSCLYIVLRAHPDGFEQPVISTVLHEVRKALVYLHAQGLIHRDIKAENKVAKGAMKLADFWLGGKHA